MRPYFINKAAEVDPREEKLPAWARDKLETLRRATADAVAELRDLKGSAEPTDFWIESRDDGSRFYLPPRSQICWGNPDDSEARVVFGAPGALHPSGWLALRGRSNLQIQPWAANTALVRDEPEPNT